MDVVKIIAEYLEANGYDGLYSEERCACKKSDLMPCEEYYSDCSAGYYVDKDSEEFDPQYDFMIGPTDFKNTNNY